MVVLGLEQEGGRRVGAYGDVWTKAQIRLVAGSFVLVLVHPQVAGVEGDGEVGAAAQLSAASTGA
jgi:hypothetical protein